MRLRPGWHVGLVEDADIKTHGALWYKANVYLADNILVGQLTKPSVELRFVNNANRTAGHAVGFPVSYVPFFFDVIQFPE